MATLPDSITALVPQHLRKTTYHAPDGGLATPVRLDANELSFAWPAELRASLQAALATTDVGRYPDPKATALKDALAARLNAELASAHLASDGSPSDRTAIDASWLCIGNGSDELISLVCNAFSQPRGDGHRANIIYPDPTFVVYRLAALANGLEQVELALDESFNLDFDIARDVCRRRAPNVAFFALPNNPSGTLWPIHDVLAMACEFPQMVVVADEAYVQYSGVSLLAELSKTPNLVIMRTLSKIGMPGLRVGYVCAHPDLVAILERSRMPYNIGSLAQAGALWLLQQGMPWVTARCADIVAAREPLAAALTVRGLLVHTSRANFLLCRVGDGRQNLALPLAQALAARGIAIRHVHRPGHLASCVRITVGTPEQNAALLAAIDANILASKE